jgi:hypothetical protein
LKNYLFFVTEIRRYPGSAHRFCPGCVLISLIQDGTNLKGFETGAATQIYVYVQQQQQLLGDVAQRETEKQKRFAFTLYHIQFPTIARVKTSCAGALKFCAARSKA